MPATTTNNNALAAAVAELNANRASIIGLATATVPKLTKKARSDKRPAADVFGGTLVKLTCAGVFVNLAYGNIINNRREGEGKAADFTPEARAWGAHREGSRVVVEYRDKLYLAAFFVHSARPRVSYWTVNGDEWTAFDVTPELKADFFPRPRPEGARQGLDSPVVYRNYLLSSVVALSHRGTQYVNREARFTPPSATLPKRWQDAVAETRDAVREWLARIDNAAVVTPGYENENTDALREAVGSHA